jgi:hypothetical protein
MTIVGMNFTKITAERKQDIKAKINISNNVSIDAVEKTEVSFGVKPQQGLKINFMFHTIYDPDFGSIELHGNLMYLENDKKIKEVADAWEKDKKLPGEVMKPVLNAVLGKCNVQALVLSRDISLPPPVPLPRVNIK